MDVYRNQEWSRLEPIAGVILGCDLASTWLRLGFDLAVEIIPCIRERQLDLYCYWILILKLLARPWNDHQEQGPPLHHSCRLHHPP